MPDFLAQSHQLAHSLRRHTVRASGKRKFRDVKSTRFEALLFARKIPIGEIVINVNQASPKVSPKVSVVVATYNSMPYLHETLLSLVAQPYRPLEIVVVDDGSIDTTGSFCAWIKSWIESRDVEYIFLPNSENRGVGYSRNRGLRAATGEFLCVFDHDDVMLYDGITKRVNFLNKKNVDVVYARRDTLIHDGHSRRVEHRTEPYHVDGFTKLATKQEQFSYLLTKRATFGHATLLYRHHILDTVGFFREERELMGMEHNGWLLKLFYFFYAHYLDEPVFLIRRGHRPDHLATAWDNHPNRSYVFDMIF